MNRFETRVMITAGVVALGATGLGTAARAQVFDAVVVQGQPTPAIYDFHFVDPPPGSPPTAQPFLLGGVGFESGQLLPQPVIDAIQWTDPLQPPPDVSPPIFLYQVGPLDPLPIEQLLVGNQFGAVGVLDGLIDFGLPTPQLLLPPIPQPPLGPGEQVFLPLPLPADPLLPNPLIFQDDPLFPDGLSPMILVGLGLPGTEIGPRGAMVFGPADPLLPPPDPNQPGGNGEFVHVPAPSQPNPCIDDSLITEAVFAYLRDQEAANGVNIMSETSVVNGVTVRDHIVSHTQADDGFTYVTVVDNFQMTAFYRFPTGTADPKLIITAPGDTDGDGDIDDADLGTAFSNYTGPLPPGVGNKTSADGDTDGDGDVDDADLGTAFSSYTGPLVRANVPEPGAVGVLLLGVGLAGRRR
ncbi:MAG: hypothetical protein ACE37H_14120 [Phycisphaeraceae bacterium]